MGGGRGFGTPAEFCELMPPEQRAQIEAVAMDMWRAYEKAVRASPPKDCVVYDLFHIVVSDGMDVLDKMRIAACRTAATDEKKRTFIKGTRYLFYKNEENPRE